MAQHRKSVIDSRTRIKSETCGEFDFNEEKPAQIKEFPNMRFLMKEHQFKISHDINMKWQMKRNKYRDWKSKQYYKNLLSTSLDSNLQIINQLHHVAPFEDARKKLNSAHNTENITQWNNLSTQHNIRDQIANQESRSQLDCWTNSKNLNSNYLSFIGSQKMERSDSESSFERDNGANSLKMQDLRLFGRSYQKNKENISREQPYHPASQTQYTESSFLSFSQNHTSNNFYKQNQSTQLKPLIVNNLANNNSCDLQIFPLREQMINRNSAQGFSNQPGNYNNIKNSNSKCQDQQTNIWLNTQVPPPKKCANEKENFYQTKGGFFNKNSRLKCYTAENIAFDDVKFFGQKPIQIQISDLKLNIDPSNRKRR